MNDSPSRTDLGPLTKKLLEQQQEIERLRAELKNAYELTKTLMAERDGARRWLCAILENQKSVMGLGVPGNGTRYDFANEQGWDCFGESKP